jgi:carbamate kinase
MICRDNSQTIVDKDDPAFQNPTKPIGSHQRSAKGQEARARRACSHLRKPNMRWAAILPAALFVSLHLGRFRQKSPPLCRF